MARANRVGVAFLEHDRDRRSDTLALMGDPGAAATHGITQPVPSAAQARIISAALELFARNGVGGTSLQMIADAIGVTKAAVYHQYNTKDEIVLAAAEAELARVEAVVRAAEAEKVASAGSQNAGDGDGRPRRRSPPHCEHHPERSGHRPLLCRARIVPPRHGADEPCPRWAMTSGHEARVSTAMLTAAISGTVMHPLVAGLDDEDASLPATTIGRTSSPDHATRSPSSPSRRPET